MESTLTILQYTNCLLYTSDAANHTPYLHDEDQSIATKYGAKRTPEFFFFNKEKSLVYHGRMDDSPKNPADVTSTDLLDAVNAVLAGKEPEVKATESIGCSVKWKA